jgi:hypothetical protein
MLQLENKSPFSPSITVLPDENGIDTLYVVVKATFSFLGGVTLAKEQTLPQMEDVFWGESCCSSIKYISEMHLTKPATDIILIGHAYAPDGTRTSQMDCGIKVGNYAKIIRVIGDRIWQGSQMSEPEPFDKMPLCYENAFGGSYTAKIRNEQGEEIEKTFTCDSNPVGKGYSESGTPPKEEIRLPNLEDAHQLIERPDDKPDPMGFGFIAPTWKPRIKYAGTYDDDWQKSRAPYLPTDFSNRFFNAASIGLVCGEYLKGDELVKLIGVCPDGSAQFGLPKVFPKCGVNIAGRVKRPEFELETIVFEPDQYMFTLTWRASLRCDKSILKVNAVKITA